MRFSKVSLLSSLVSTSSSLSSLERSFFARIIPPTVATTGKTFDDATFDSGLTVAAASLPQAFAGCAVPLNIIDVENAAKRNICFPFLRTRSLLLKLGFSLSLA